MPPSLDVKSLLTFDSEIRYVAFPESNDSCRWTVKSLEPFDLLRTRFLTPRFAPTRGLLQHRCFDITQLLSAFLAGADVGGASVFDLNCLRFSELTQPAAVVVVKIGAEGGI